MATRRRSATRRSPTRSTPRRSRTDTTSSRCGSRGTSTASTRWPSPRRGLPRRSLRVHRVADLRRPVARAWTTSATAPVRAWPATAWATRWSAATTSPRSRPTTGKALEWNPTGGSNSFEGNKAMEATPRGLFIGGDGMFQGGVRTGRVALLRLQHRDRSRRRCPTRRSRPRSRAASSPTTRRSRSPARRGSTTGTVGRVQVQIQDRDSSQYLQDNGTASPPSDQHRQHPQRHARRRDRHDAHLVDLAGHDRHHQPQPAGLRPRPSPPPPAARATRPRPTKKFESFSTEDQTPTTTISGPSGIQTSTTFTDDRHRQRRQGRQLAELTGSATSSSATCRTTAP